MVRVREPKAKIAAEPGGSPGNRQQDIVKFMRESEVDIEQLDHEIARIQEEAKGVPRLIEHRRELAAQAMVLRTEIYPPTRIPAEILAENFERVISEQVIGREVLLPLRRNGYHWRLGLVCSYWRQVLWSTPRLWRAIVIFSYLHSWPRPRRDDYIHKSFHNIFSKITGLFSLHIRDHIPIATLLPVLFRFSIIHIVNLIYADFLAIVDLPPESLTSLETLDIKIELKVGDRAVFREISSLHSAHPSETLQSHSMARDLHSTCQCYLSHGSS